MLPLLTIALFCGNVLTTVSAAVTTPAVETECGSTIADILFIMDGSGSVSSSDWEKQKSFVKSLITDFDVGPNKVRIGIMRFSSNYTLDNLLSGLQDKTGLHTLLNGIRQPQGGTATDLALKAAREIVFTAVNGDRPNAPNIAILLTDGSSNNPSLSITQAKLLQGVPASVFAIAIGSAATTGSQLVSELQNMVSPPASTYLQAITNFNALSAIRSLLVKSVCQAIVSAAPPVTQCASQADIVFIMDGSGSVSPTDWEQQKKFMKSMIREFDVAESKVRIGIMSFSSSVRADNLLAQRQNGSDLLNLIDRLTQPSGGTATHLALKMARETYFTVANGDRSGVPNIVILLTDGQSDSAAASIAEAQLLKSVSTLFAIAVGNAATPGSALLTELTSMVSSPPSTYLQPITDFKALDSIKTHMVDQVCKTASDPLQPTTAPKCSLHKADVVFAVDTSSSVGEAHFNLTKAFLESLLEMFDFSTMRAGVIKFNDYISPVFELNQFKTLNEYKAAIENMKYDDGPGTLTSDALRHMRYGTFTPVHGDRPDAPNIGIVVTDGKSKDGYRTYFEANLTRDEGVILMTVGIGNEIDTEELQNIANLPSSEFVHLVKSFQELSTIKQSLMAQLCKGYVITPPTSPPPTVCQDILDCSGYNRNSVCLEQKYRTWATSNCPVYCDLCGPNTITLTPTVKPCADTITNCADYVDVCTQPEFKAWATERCSRFCGWCDLTTTRWTQPPTPPKTTTPYVPPIRPSTTQPTTVTTPTPTAFVPLDPNCYDKDRQCTGYPFNNCNETKYEAYMKGNCQEYCGFCTPAVTKPCIDVLNDCFNYEDSVCLDPAYRSWAKANCPRRCGFCPGQTSLQPPTTPSGCFDLEDCPSFGDDVCSDHKEWAQRRCAAFCGFCASSTTKPPCIDKEDCSRYAIATCSNPEFRDYMKAHCRKFCNLCDA